MSDGRLTILEWLESYLSDRNQRVRVGNTNEDLRSIYLWCCQNSSLINADETKALIIGIPQLLRRVPSITISIFGKEITK